MALSDSCSEALHAIAQKVVWYSDWGYKPIEVIPVIDALYNLATFIAGQNSPPNMPNADPSAGISRVVVGAILGAEIDDDEYGEKIAAAILTLLPEICKIHPQLAKSLDDIYIEATTNADSFMPKMYPNILSKLEAIKSNQS